MSLSYRIGNGGFGSMLPKDFEKGHNGFSSVADVAAKYADQLADSPEDRAAMRDKKAAIAFLEYDWTQNDAE